jgi:predicted site-specific integrase-resolvase
MNDTASFGFPEAAHRLGVSLRVLRLAIRAGKVPAPAQQAATAKLSAAWLDSVLSGTMTSPF